VGVTLLSGISPKIDLIAEGVGAHHEWWNGGGYPRRLEGDKIPLVGRIVTVCDVFEAMSTRRSYHAALPVGEALAHVEGRSGTQFDPTVVHWFTRLFHAGEIFDSRYPMPPEEWPSI
jgi:putative two-component system response regulator